MMEPSTERGLAMRCAALTLLALSVPMMGLSACAEPVEVGAPIGNAPVFTTYPEYFARAQAYGPESPYLTLAGAPFYTTDIAYFVGPTRIGRHGSCPPRGHGHGHGGHHH
jgi:hypothetical protein